MARYGRRRLGSAAELEEEEEEVAEEEEEEEEEERRQLPCKHERKMLPSLVALYTGSIRSLFVSHPTGILQVVAAAGCSSSSLEREDFRSPQNQNSKGWEGPTSRS